MARKYPRVKVPNVKEIYSSYNEEEKLEFHVRYKPKGQKNPFPFANYTKIFELYDLPEKEHLEEVIELRLDVDRQWRRRGTYLIDEKTGNDKKREIKKLEKKEQRKIDVLFDSIYQIVIKRKVAKTTLKSYEANYNRHIKPFLGAKSVYDIKYKDIENIFNRMEDPKKNGTGSHIYHKRTGSLLMENKEKKLSLATKKNVLTIFRKVFGYLNDDTEDYKDFYFNPSKKILKKIIDVEDENILKEQEKREEEAKKSGKKQNINLEETKEEINTPIKYAPLHHRLKTNSRNDMLNIVKKLYQEISKMIKVRYKKDGTPRKIQSDIQRTQVYFFASLMTARRISELQRVPKSIIIDGNVFVTPEKTKTKIYDEFPLPPEVMEAINLEDDYPLKISYGAANRNWHVFKEAIGMKDMTFNNYDFRHLFATIMSEYYDRPNLSLCISHSSGDSVKSNEHYFSLPLEDKRKIFEKYWELIREPIS